MVTVIPQRELRNQNAHIIDAVAAGETFVITRHGTPIAELRPVAPARRRFVPKRELLALVGAAATSDAAQFRADMDQSLDQLLR